MPLGKLQGAGIQHPFSNGSTSDICSTIGMNSAGQLPERRTRQRNQRLGTYAFARRQIDSRLKDR
jgi:hypothetical protein